MRLYQFLAIILFTILSNYSSLGQAILPTSRTTWTGGIPAGWTQNGTVPRTSTSACTGSNAGTFNDSGDRIVVNFDSDASDITFSLKKQSMSGTSFILLESSEDGVNWTNIDTYGTAASATTITDCAPITVALECGIRYIRWTYTKSGGNCDIDDVSISKRPTPCVTVPNTISITSVSSYNINLPCGQSFTSSLAFTSTDVFLAGNSYSVELSNSAGVFPSTPTVIGTLNSSTNDGTISITFPSGTPNGTNYRVRIVSNDPTVISSESDPITINNVPCEITPTLNGAPFTVDCDNSDNGSVNFTSVGTFATGNIYSVELSNAAGVFPATPNVIGTLNSSANSGTININIPAQLTTSANYRIRIVSSNPSAIGTVSSNFQITLIDGPCELIPPYMVSAYINSCNGTCQEGDNELVFGTTGSYSFEVQPSNFRFSYGSNSPGTIYTNSLVNNPTTIALLNAEAACGNLFIDANDQIIPENATWMLAPNSLCVEALDWTGLCGSGPIYVIFQNDSGWNTNGTFVNGSSGSSGARYFRTVISTTSNETFQINYNINIEDYVSYTDGLYANFDSDGGVAISYGDDDCILTPSVLNTELILYQGTYINQYSLLEWKTNSETNNDYFTITRSTDGYEWTTIGRIDGNNTSKKINKYELIDPTPAKGINYYKLSSTDFDGKTHFKGIVAIEVDQQMTYYNQITQSIELLEKVDVEIYSTDGKLVQSGKNTNSVPFQKKGMFIIHFTKTGKSERIIVQ